MSTKNIENLANEVAMVVGQILRKMRNASPNESDLSWTQKSVMVRLDKEGPMTISNLARAEGVKSQSMGSAVDGLETLDFVERKAHPTDGRQVNIHLTAQGAQIRKKGRDARRGWLADALKKLEKQEQETLTEAVDILKKIAEI